MGILWQMVLKIHISHIFVFLIFFFLHLFTAKGLQKNVLKSVIHQIDFPVYKLYFIKLNNRKRKFDRIKNIKIY